jgi:hypothetical protein
MTEIAINNLEEATVAELIDYCRDNGFTGYSKAKREGKAALINWIYEKYGEVYSEASGVQVPDQDEDEDDVPGAERVEAGGDKKVWVVPKKAAVDPDVDGHLEFHPSVEVEEEPVSSEAEEMLQTYRELCSPEPRKKYDRVEFACGCKGMTYCDEGQTPYVNRSIFCSNHIGQGQEVKLPTSMAMKEGEFRYWITSEIASEAGVVEGPVSSIDGGVEGPVVSQSLSLGSEVIVKLDGFSLNGARGVVAGQVDSDLASVSIFNVGDVVVPFCILYPAPSDEPENYGFKLGDEIEVSGYLMDGQQGVVVGCDSKGINVALKSGAVNRIPAWALKKIENPPPPFSFHQIIKIHCLLIERVIETWMAHCGAEIEDGLPVFSFQKHHNLQLVTDAAKEDPFLYMALFSDGDKSGWVGLWLSQEESRYFSGDIQRAKEIFSEIKATVWDFNSLEDISTDTLLKYQKVKWENMGFRQDEDDGMLFFDFEDDRMSHKDDCRFIGNSIIDIDLFEDNYNDEAFVPVTINEKKAVLATGTKSEMRDLYKSLYNLLTIWGTP